MKNHPILDVNATLHSGDIILFSGETLFSHTIRNVTNSRWSHCGMAIFDKRFGANVQIWDVSKKKPLAALSTYMISKAASLPIKARFAIALFTISILTTRQRDVALIAKMLTPFHTYMIFWSDDLMRQVR